LIVDKLFIDNKIILIENQNYRQLFIVNKISDQQLGKVDENSFLSQLLIDNRLKKLNTATLNLSATI
jgi:hypothetical protein